MPGCPRRASAFGTRAARGLLAIGAIALTGSACSPGERGAESPPWKMPPAAPTSDAPIREVHFHPETLVRLAPGSDNWPLTWAADGHQYTTFGDGGGFGGSNRKGRVSLGVARIEGPAHRYRGVNVWGGHRSEHPASFEGKSYGILAEGGALYLWVAPGSDARNYERQTLHRSSDGGATWSAADWSFTAEDRLILPSFCQFGPGYAGARDEYVYMYAARLDAPTPERLGSQREGKLDLFRAPRARLMERDAYEFFAGLGARGEARWTRDAGARRPTLDDPTRSLGFAVSATYNAGLGRYLLAAEQGSSMQGGLSLFEAPEPWGPWRAVARYSDWLGLGPTFYWSFSNKWTSEDGRHLVLVFTGHRENDSWNSLRASLVLADD